jgi:CRP-like cAMP-binding protein
VDVARAEWLRRVPVFGALRDDSIALLLDHARVAEVAAGDYFFREGDPADGMYVVEAGQAAVEKTWRGQPFELHRLMPGDCFGEMALLDLFPRSASIRAVDDCTAIEITPGALLGLYERDPEQFALVQMNLAREVCRRLRATEDLLFRARLGPDAPA